MRSSSRVTKSSEPRGRQFGGAQARQRAVALLVVTYPSRT